MHDSFDPCKNRRWAAFAALMPARIVGNCHLMGDGPRLEFAGMVDAINCVRLQRGRVSKYSIQSAQGPASRQLQLASSWKGS